MLVPLIVRYLPPSQVERMPSPGAAISTFPGPKFE
jgi:hypothetical protein